jgi:hypothetical protein
MEQRKREILDRILPDLELWKYYDAEYLGGFSEEVTLVLGELKSRGYEVHAPKEGCPECVGGYCNRCLESGFYITCTKLARDFPSISAPCRK